MSDIAVKFENISKFYKLYTDPKDRLKEALHPLKKKYHKKFYALKNINLEIKKGEILGIIGRNGSGKSTLLKIITRIVQPSFGRIAVTGAVSALLELSSGLNPEFTGIQNIYFNGTMMGFSRQEMKEKIGDIVDFADIGDFIHQPLKTYSSGMKARLGFALAINMDPEILIMDEVLSVGDELFKRKCYAKMEDFFNSGSTVLFVSHSMGSINEICKRVVLLDNGEKILEGPPKFVTMHYQKLLFALPEYRKKVRDELLQLNNDEERKKNFLEYFEENQKEEDTKGLESEAKKSNQPQVQQLQRSLYIPNFLPKSTVKIQNDIVDICQSRLTTLEGEVVNALVMNEEFLYSYDVKFNAEVKNVHFGMGIKSEKGVPLIWIFYPGLKQYMERKFYVGETYRVFSRFKCLLLPGNYYLEAAIRSLKKTEEVQLAKIVDDIVFKVQDVPGMKKGGIFDSYQSMRLEKIT